MSDVEDATAELIDNDHTQEVDDESSQQGVLEVCR